MAATVAGLMGGRLRVGLALGVAFTPTLPAPLALAWLARHGLLDTGLALAVEFGLWTIAWRAAHWYGRLAARPPALPPLVPGRLAVAVCGHKVFGLDDVDAELHAIVHADRCPVAARRG